MFQPTTKDLDFVLIGRITIDFNPQDYYNSLDQLNFFQKYIGGSTGNTAIGLHRNQQKVVLVTKVGADGFGQTIRHFLASEQMNSQYVMTDPVHPTGLTFTEMLSPEQSRILMYRTEVADLYLHPDEIDPDLIARSKYLLISGTALSSSPSREAVLKAVLIAKQTKTKVIFDIDYRPYNWVDQATVCTYYQLVATQADLLIGSQEELSFCSQFTRINLEPFDSKTVAEYWLQTAELVIIKNGKKGSECFSRTQYYHVGIIPVTMLKGYGGGDAYASYFLTFYNQNPQDLQTALIYASAAASYMVQSHSSFNHPYLTELKAWIDEHTNHDPEQLILTHQEY
ncbi:5-dehydro-2-deoxygluconokinase [Mycoplasmoides fastidiosum]|uniref:5-dehydro-2-deoxygluconokinase n=1 Tax=Mycoplasmoides fastidiosum TaxID=92758 RepID=A0ABU0LZK2_9BACT|nr:PfkB family carbohydrate kinase [Mycoplasmoides fastidiosum]MDQ0514113.1 5-dehydro-2-deoxygluconokinase [Mycoplasmoides fastidiosum]UUD37479.1 PfkB family carbohydrate kinase [Mycoplasmoides fastidiosum]